MGQSLAEGLGALDDLRVVALVDVVHPAELFGAVYAPSLSELDATLVDVVVDFSSPSGVVTSASWCADHGVALVVGATGLSESERAALERAGEKVAVIAAANFSVGAVLAEQFAATAAAFFDGVEIVELHHDAKADAPSGTSLATAAAIARARVARGAAPFVDSTQRRTLDGARGASADGGVRVHSVRLPGLLAHHEIILASPGECLTIRHDSFDRRSFLQGVALAVRYRGPTPCFLTSIASLLAPSGGSTGASR